MWISTRLIAGFLVLVLVAPCCQGADDQSQPPPQSGGLFALPNLLTPTEPNGAGQNRAALSPATDFNPWSEWERRERAPRNVRSVTAGDWGSLTATSVVGDATAPTAWEDPLQHPQWKTDGAWRYSVTGPLFVFGQFGGAGTEIAQQDTKMAGRTGVGCKWTPVEDAEFVVRSGPSVTYSDPLRPDRTKERSEWLVEVQAHWPILGKIGLDYQATAAPALSPLEHDWINNDLGLAAPLGSNGKVRLGARHRWDNVADPKSTLDSMQLYFGLELAH
jgi:Protein of unknown function, DUF481